MGIHLMMGFSLSVIRSSCVGVHPTYIMSLMLLSQSITEPDVIGPLIQLYHSTLYSLKTLGRCEILLYLSGHGVHLGSIGGIPNIFKPHPVRADLRDKDPAQCYNYILMKNPT